MKGTVTQIAGLVTAVLEGETPDGRPIVSWAGGREGPQVARCVWMEPRPAWSMCRGSGVILGFEDGDERKPVVLGLLDEPFVEERKTPLNIRRRETEGSRPDVLRIESAQELILECGKAKIALRADGRVSILGGYVVSRSSGVNKIKGGSVQIN